MTLRYRLLGPLDVVDDTGRPVELGGPKPRAVLAVLLLDAGHVVAVDRLIEALWGDEPPPSAQGTLQAYVSNLRRALGGPTVLVTQAPGYRLDVDPSAIDAVMFERHLAEATDHLAGGRPLDALTELDEARRLWRGPVLADPAYERFAAAEAARLDELHLRVIERWAEAALAAGRHAEVAAELAAQVAEHPLRAGLRASLMLALYRAGRQSDALRVYDDGRRVLRDELGAEPEAELQRLQDRILAHDPALDAPPARLTAAPPSVPAAIGTAPASGFVGRDEELSRVDRVLDGLAGGRGGVVLLSGEAGIGKTRLAEAVAERARSRGVIVSWGRSFESEGTPAFWPWVEVLRHAFAGLDADGPGAVVREVGAGAGLLVRLVPELAPLLPAAPAGMESADDGLRFSLNDAVARTVVAVADRRPLVVVLDDVHWADAPTLRLLRVLAVPIASHPLVLVVTYRDDEIGPDLTDALAALGRAESVERIELAGLDEADVGRLLRERLVEPPTTDVVRAITDRSAGNPFFVGELARLLGDEPSPAVTGADVPPGVREVIRRRIQRLPEGVERLLIAAAVAGREFDLRVAARAAELDETDDATLDLVDAALEAHLLEEGARVGRFRFPHALVREAIVSGLSGPRRTRMHRRLAAVLAALPGTGRAEDLAALAFHALEGAAAADAGEALGHAQAAIGAAMAALSFEEAAALGELALAVLERTGAGDDETRFGLLLDLGIARRRQGDLAGGREALGAALALARTLHREDAPLLVAETALHFSGGAWWGWWSELGAADEPAIAALEDALDRLPPEPSSTRAEVLSRLAIELHFAEGAEARRDDVSAEALAMARGLGDRALAHALAARHVAVWRPGNAGERRVLADELVATARRARSTELEAFGHHFLLLSAIERGDSAAAAAQLDEGERVARALPLPHLTAQVAWSRSMLAAVTGRFDDAERLQDEALASTSRWSEAEALRTWSAQRIALRWEQGRGIELADPLRGLVEREAINVNWKTGLALVLADAGERDEAQALFDDVAAAGFADVPHDLGRLFNLAVRALSAWLLDDAARATLLLPLLEPFVGGHVVQPTRLVYAGPVAFHAGCLRIVAGDVERGAVLLRQAVAEAAKLGASGYVARAEAQLGRLAP